MIFVGVDGGGTKTAVAAYESGKLVAEARSGPMNYNFIGVEQAAENLISGIGALGVPPHEIAAIGIGDPSIDDAMPPEEELPSAHFIRLVYERLRVPIYVRSDAYITLFGLTGGSEPAVLMLSGTGAMGIAERFTSDGSETRVAGGWGRITGDEGSGYYIASEAVKAALHAADGIAPKTILTDAALCHFGVSAPRELIGVFYGEGELDIASFAKDAAACADRGDDCARGILLKAARYLASYTSALIDWSGSRKVGIYGSVICGNAVVRGEFESILRGRYADVTISEPSVSPQEAAAGYAQLQWNKERI